MISIALYKPDIPQNTAAIIRLCACFKMKVHIIEPCGFNLEDQRFKRVAMDYMKLSDIIRYPDYDNFENKNLKSRIILMTTKAKKNYHKFRFKKNDILLFGRESAGVPKIIHDKVKNRLRIPMQKKTRSLNIAISVAISSSEALKQNNFF
jgi:tRNA (cytidine/uridine-2'-O-)-methyltransferase